MVKMFNWLFNNKKDQVKVEPTRTPRKSAKQIATDKGEPYVELLGMEVDQKNIRQGEFELDWNIYFINKLRESGYVGKTDEQLVDQWFQDICRHIVLETYEQDIAMNMQVEKRDLGDGKVEYK